jgi:drug/metabolite transporter (DMT)-like permease
MFTSTALLFALAAMFLWSVGDFFIHKATKKIAHFQALIFVNLTGGIILLPFAARSFHELSTGNIAPLAALALVDLAYGLAILKAYEQGKLSIIEVILTLELPLTVFFGLLFFHESLSWLQTALILVIIGGIFFISRESKTFYRKVIDFILRRKTVLEKGAVMAIAASFLSAFYNFFIALNARDVSPFLTIWLPWVISLTALMLYFYFRHGFKNGVDILADDLKKYKKIILIGSVFDAFAWVFYASAVSRQELAIVTAITESYPALIIVYGVKFNKEKMSKWQYLGAALALGGSLVIALIS